MGWFSDLFKDKSKERREKAEAAQAAAAQAEQQRSESERAKRMQARIGSTLGMLDREAGAAAFQVDKLRALAGGEVLAGDPLVDEAAARVDEWAAAVDEIRVTAGSIDLYELDRSVQEQALGDLSAGLAAVRAIRLESARLLRRANERAAERQAERARLEALMHEQEELERREVELLRRLEQEQRAELARRRQEAEARARLESIRREHDALYSQTAAGARAFYHSSGPCPAGYTLVNAGTRSQGCERRS